ncbi:MAG: YbhB/YbcL family Raf kinase inhibitor-like protein [Promethearchaeota archaeon]
MSNDVENNKKIPSLFTCDGADLHPHLKWKDEPISTHSFALSFVDVDNENGIWGHWHVCNIPKEIKEIPRGEVPKGEEVKNDFGTLYYVGPCSAKLHRYVFTLYALKIDRLENLNALNFRKKIESYSIDKAQLMVFYEREIPDKIFI